MTERTLTRKGQATRERIVAAATELIARQGVAGTSTEQVRDAAGVSGSQLYHYFDSKQALIRAVITRQADAVGDADGLPRLGALDSFDALQAWADAAIERQAENGGRGECSLGTLAAELSVSDEDSRAELSTGFLRWKDLLHDGLHRMQERGELRADADLDQLAYALLAALQGGTLMSQTLRSTDPFRASMAAALAYVRSFEVG
ncbi:TetR/AcrR family transcriptional regulator [Nocardioides conyzicola]|uniref:TetR/AcrR family transcriptional regulator n=1 Tax=Nocardioides conyzicola TaxID=1651781 RepID=A0ABP8X8E4_9ACTN